MGGERGRGQRALRGVAVVLVLTLFVSAKPVEGAPAPADTALVTTSVASGDGTYQWWWKWYGCTLTVQTEGGIYTGATVTGNWQLWAQAVNGGNKIGKIQAKFMLIAPDENGRWVQLDGSKVTQVANVNKKATHPAYFNYKPTVTLTNIATPVSNVWMVYKIDFRKWYGLFGAGFWKTKKRASDIYPTYEVTRLAGWQLGDVKDWVQGTQCRTVTQ
jgi:hypothetical protein